MNFKRLFTVAVLGVSALCGCSRDEGWTYLIDENLSQWRTYQSYELPADYRGRRTIMLEDGSMPQPLGYDMNLKDTYTTVKEGKDVLLKIASGVYGCIFTKESFSNYELVLELRYGKDSWGPREGKPIDSGLLYHSVGECGVDYWVSWMQSIEFQVLASGSPEGVTGDFWSVAGTKVDAKVTRNDDLRRYMFDPEGGEWRTVTSCFTKDYNNPTGEWDELRLITYEGKSLYFVNGNLAMAHKNAKYVDENGEEHPLREGKIQLANEAGEIYYKNIRIRPIDGIPAEYDRYFE